MVAIKIQHRRGGCEKLAGHRRVVFTAATSRPAERGLGFDIHAQFIAGLEKFAGRRIMRRADIIEISAAQELRVLEPMFGGVGAAAQRVGFMTIDARQFYGAPVDKQLTVAHLHLSETNLLLHFFEHSSARVETGGQVVKIRFLGVPEGGVIHRQPPGKICFTRRDFAQRHFLLQDTALLSSQHSAERQILRLACCI